MNFASVGEEWLVMDEKCRMAVMVADVRVSWKFCHDDLLWSSMRDGGIQRVVLLETLVALYVFMLEDVRVYVNHRIFIFIVIY
ncbi:hypothetical protein ALMA_1541 [Alloscardovia macacae]|uniref:Uncharacterized protein n=1 Tax=Alloscardovia macacae TaxID=1160091 RepID=A0A261F070_9BIFI|nr:hypothetical protein ALMA_1541 [Alloscardovia macacae]